MTYLCEIAMGFLAIYDDAHVLVGDIDLYNEIHKNVVFKHIHSRHGFTFFENNGGGSVPRVVDYRDFVNNEPMYLTGALADSLLIITDDISSIPKDNMTTLKNLLNPNNNGHLFIHS